VAYCPGCKRGDEFFACYERGRSAPRCPQQRCPPECQSAQGPETCLALGVLGCEPAFCPTCGDEKYINCFGPGELPDPCPGVVCAPSCRTALDCTAQQRCLPPGDFAGCGPCQQVEEACATDTDCAPGDVCQPLPCACQGESICQPGCAGDADCKEAEMCGDDGRCQALPCGKGPASCPPNFACTPSAEGGPRCARKSCEDDRACDEGYCVEGDCHTEPGTCVVPPA
jgi:hypothetical protein